MVHIYTGTGKGKTTAALGLIARSLGRDKWVCLIQFMKKNCEYGEIQFFSKEKNLDIFQFGTDKLIEPNKPTQIDLGEADAAYQMAKQVLESQKYDLVVIDEINVAVSWGLLDLAQQLELMQLAKDTELVMTGRYATLAVIEKADLVTEMREVKHYFSKGVKARKGIEF
ncbi:MAG: cob(I)yrinic acid a,c-diamide adenosyltransferase [Candidatus Cloacimonadota bacterium]|nr:cob(I)yrinic acid a,c-diamide adenosyltransferase [Candidatus Cloacimonadota bacterium]